MTWDQDEIKTQTGRKLRAKAESLSDLSELLGAVMSEQVRQDREIESLRKVSRRPPPLMSKKNLTAIISVTTIIVSSIFTILRELGILK